MNNTLKNLLLKPLYTCLFLLYFLSGKTQVDALKHLSNISFTNSLATGCRVSFVWDTAWVPEELHFVYDTTSAFLHPSSVRFTSRTAVINYNGMVLKNKKIYFKFLAIDVAVQCFQTYDKPDSFITTSKYTRSDALSTGINGSVVKVQLYGLSQPKMNVRVKEFGEGSDDPNAKIVYSIDTTLVLVGNHYELTLPIKNLASENSYIVYTTSILGTDTVTSENNFAWPGWIVTSKCAGVAIASTSLHHSNDTIQVMVPVVYPPRAGSSYVQYRFQIMKNGQTVASEIKEVMLKSSNTGASFVEDTIRALIAGLKINDYKVVVQVIDPCGFSSTREFNYSTAGIAQVKNGAVKVYPNPFTDQITIKSDMKQNIIIVDAVGKQIFAGLVDKVTIETGALPVGIYIVQLENGARIKVVK